MVHGCGLVALAYKSKTYENLFCGVFCQIYEKVTMAGHSKTVTEYAEK